MSKKCFSHQIVPLTATLSFYAVLKHFYRNWQKYLLFMSKKCFSHQIVLAYSYTKLLCCFKVFFTEIDKIFVLLSKKCFSQQIETHTCVFLIKMSKIPLNEVCLLYWSIYTEIDRKIVIYVNKVFFSTNCATYS